MRALRREVVLLDTEELPDAVRGRLLTSLARSQWRTGEMEASLQSTDEALELLGEESEPRDYTVALTTRGEGAALHRSGRAEEALENLTSAYDSLCEQQRRWLASLAATEAAYAAHAVEGEEATEWLERASKILADLDIEPTALAHRAYVHARDLIAR